MCNSDPCIERLARFSCSLPLSIFLFSPTHNVLHKKLNFASSGVHVLAVQIIELALRHA